MHQLRRKVTVQIQFLKEIRASVSSFANYHPKIQLGGFKTNFRERTF